MTRRRQPKQPPAQAERVRVTIIKQGHTHRGKPLQVGDSVEVRPDQAERMKSAGVI